MTGEAKRRSYQQFCGLAKALDVLGERWTLLVVRNLLLGPRRYSDLLAELPGITTNLLAKRLKELEEAGIIERRERPPPVPATVYQLTKAGEELEPVVMELARWGSRYLDRPRRGETVNVGWGLLALKRRYRGGLSAVVEVVTGERRFELAFQPNYLRVQERAAVDPVLTLEAAPETLRGLFFLGAPAETLRTSGALRVTGEEATFARVLDALGLGGSRAA